ncbi:MAG: hypothetical protein Ct9H300mP2_3990 [Candidatus Neomarinimicrobiota bacterium]|nr:MAG: hypothetical protein Ct9H300mP2_3990 [Candidatus Neomarinimicrobiota bacterium]
MFSVGRNTFYQLLKRYQKSAKALWLQDGVINKDAAKLAKRQVTRSNE